MLRLATITAFLLLAGILRADPQEAVVRIRSHGASGTVVYTDGQRSLILSCAHMFWAHNSERESPAMRAKTIVLDIGVATDQKTDGLHSTSRVLAVDSRLDLSLIEVDMPLPHVAPIAATANQNRRLLSIGYDDMKWPATRRTATILRVEGTRSITREKPWHGRSGGALIDVDTGELVGVVSGYQSSGPSWHRSLFDELTARPCPSCPGGFAPEYAPSPNYAPQSQGPGGPPNRGSWREVSNDGAGIYVSHQAILEFVGWAQRRK